MKRGPGAPVGPGGDRSDEMRLTGNAYRNSPHQIGDGNLQVNTWNLPREGRAQVVGWMPDVGRWIDRETATRQVLAGLDPRRSAPGPVVVHGPAGVGKTLLARAVAQEARRAGRRWFSGELFIDVDNRPGDVRTPGDVLSRALRLLAVVLDRPVPGAGALEEQRGLFCRYLLDHAEAHGKPMLIVVDGATTAEQVTPFLPPGGTGRLLVTSRGQMAELLDEHAGFHALDRLAPSDAVALLESVVGHALGGDRRIADDSEAALAVADLCDRLPFALMRAAHLLVTRPGMSAGALRDRLADSSNRLGELRSGDRSVRSTLNETYRLLSTPAQRMLQLLPLHPGADIGVHAAAALAGVSPALAGDRLSELHGLRFLERGTGYDGYRFESLVLLYAQERCREVAAVEREAAFARLVDHYDVTVGAAVTRLPGEARRARRPYGKTSRRGRAPHSAARAAEGLRATGSALAWLDAERPNLVAAMVRSQDHPSSRNRAVSLALALTPYFDLRKHWDDWVLSHEVAAHAAERLGLAERRSDLLRETGRAYHQQGLLEEALGYYRKAVDAWPSRKGHHPEEAVSLLYRALSELDAPQRAGDEGVAALSTVLEQCERPPGHWQAQETGSGIAAILNNLGVVEARRGNDRRALICHERAVEHSERARDRGSEGRSLLHLGNAHMRSGDPRAACDSYERALRAFPAEDSFGRGQAAYNLGLARAASGDVRETRQRLEAAARYFSEVHPGAARHTARDLERRAREAHRSVRRLFGRRASLRRIPLKPLSPLVALPPAAALLLDDVSPHTPDMLALGRPLPDGHTASHGLVEPSPPDDAALAALPVGGVADATGPAASPLPVDAAEERPPSPLRATYSGTGGSRTHGRAGGHRPSAVASDEAPSSSDYGSSSDCHSSSSSSSDSHGSSSSYDDDSSSGSGASSSSGYGDDPY
ncbi:tetratricopeptide repeat protein [Streptomyces sp. NPDC017448]|uniref:tetratricopeptide repeat protein n=1 Tax=Streptomyces sp. NPDC017448 TaxID=3364996 RepID=UPI0037B37B31